MPSAEMDQAPANCFPADRVKRVCQQGHTHPPPPGRHQKSACSTFRGASNPVGEALLTGNKKAEPRPHAAVTVNRDLVSSGGTQDNEHHDALCLAGQPNQTVAGPFKGCGGLP